MDICRRSRSLGILERVRGRSERQGSSGAKVVSEPRRVGGFEVRSGLGSPVIGLEGGRVAMALWRAMKKGGLTVRASGDTDVAILPSRAMPVKSDPQRCAQDRAMMRLGWFRPGDLKSIRGTKRSRDADGAPRALQRKLIDSRTACAGSCAGAGSERSQKGDHEDQLAGRIEEW